MKGIICVTTGLTKANAEHDTQCESGIARMAIRVGDIRRGVNLALEINSRYIVILLYIILDRVQSSLQPVVWC